MNVWRGLISWIRFLSWRYWRYLSLLLYGHRIKWLDIYLFKLIVVCVNCSFYFLYSHSESVFVSHEFVLFDLFHKFLSCFRPTSSIWTVNFNWFDTPFNNSIFILLIFYAIFQWNVCNWIPFFVVFHLLEVTKHFAICRHLWVNIWTFLITLFKVECLI